MYIPVRSKFARLLMAACLLAAAAYPVKAVAAGESTFRTYKDVSGFSCEFPSDWSFEQATNSDRVFTSANIRDATIIIQVIDREITAEKTAAAQLEGLKVQLLQAEDGRILNEATAPVADQQAPYLIASYTTTDTRGLLRRFRHIQMVVTAPRVFLLMSYSSPDGGFDEHIRVFQHCSATLKIEAAATPAPPAAQPPDNPDAVGVDPGSEITRIWRHNTDRDFWIAVPSIWSKEIDDAEPYSVDMQHPDRVEGVIVFVVDMEQTSGVKDYADGWEQYVAGKIFFMNDRLALPETGHPATGLPKVTGIMRQYQGQINGATVRSLAAYVVNKKRGYTVVGYHFLGDHEGGKRIRDAVESFRLAAP